MANTDIVQCAACHGRGSWKEPILDFGEGPEESCGYCQGTGRTTKMMNAWIMRWARDARYNPSAAAEAAHQAAMAAK